MWTGTQRPFAVRDELVRAVGLPQERVRVIVPDTGSGYGGKHSGEVAVEAARLARGSGQAGEARLVARGGVPLGVLPSSGRDRRRRRRCAPTARITGWTFDNYNSGPAAIRPTYAIANQRVTFHPSDSPLRQGSYRGLASTANNFAREMHVDELARLVERWIRSRSV